MSIIRFIKNWTLIISILAGIFGYFIYVNIPFLDGTHHLAYQAITIIQPLLIFTMLFITFCKVNPKRLRLCKWHLWLLLIQAGSFTLLALIQILLPEHLNLRIILEGAMICMICPTATAGAVITRKLGGKVTHITTYTILINLVTALLIPLLVPFVHPNPDLNISTSAVLILGKVFPLLLPFLAAILLRYLSPRLHFMFSHCQELSFYLWALALALATTVTTRSIMHSDVSIETQLWLVVVSFICCGLQFYFGKKIGKGYGDSITAGQSLGQKNTVLAIWMGYTFFSPITSIVGGFYSIWHNLVNTYQLYQARKKGSL